jgi:hypothetical protein
LRLGEKLFVFVTTTTTGTGSAVGLFFPPSPGAVALAFKAGAFTIDDENL